MKKFVFSVASRATGRLQIKPSGSGDENGHELLVVFGFSTPNSNRTDHKLRKKLANEKQRHMSLWLYGVRTRYCALFADALYKV